MKNLNLSLAFSISVFLLQLAIGTSLKAQTYIPEGNVSGIWTNSGSPYMVSGEIFVPNGDSLIIKPGVEVIFTSHDQFFINGRLLAVGKPDSLISFTAEDTTEGWMGLGFLSIDPANDSSKLVYCEVSRAVYVQDMGNPIGGRGIGIVNSDKILISHCHIIKNRTISNNTTGGAGIGVINGSPRITNNFIAYNEAVGGHGGGVILSDSANPIFTNNILFNNSAHGGGGIVTHNGRPVFINNTIVFNKANHGGGLDCLFGSAVLINCILYGNTANDVGNQVHFGYEYSSSFYHNLIEGGQAGFAQNHTPTAPSFSGVFENNIDDDPRFVNDGLNFNLTDSSACIGAGIASIMVEGNQYFAPDKAHDNLSRPRPTWSNPDLGGLEHDLAYTTAIDPEQKDRPFALLQNYPNPAQEETFIQYVVNRPGDVKLEIRTLTGKSLRILLEEYHAPGEYVVNWDTDDIPGGAYLMVLSMEAKLDSRIIIIQ